MILESDAILWPDGRITGGRITITGDEVSAVAQIPDLTAQPDAEVERIDGLIAPGFVDTHVHAGGGGDFAATDPARILQARDFHRSHGTTSIIASVVTDTLDTIVAELAVLTELCRAGEFDGIHLETPFLAEARCGAHPPALLRHPDPETVDRLLSAGGDCLSMITIAPELPGAIEAIDTFVAAGVRVAVGHTAGTVDDAKRAIDHGATVATHLFNAMNPIHHRDPGPVPVLLTDPRVAVELICDGVHLAPEVIAMAVETAGPERTMLVTDAMIAAGLPDDTYQLGTLQVAVVDGRARLITADGTPGSIAGSTLTLAEAVQNVMRFAELAPAEAIRLATATPATVHGLTRSGRIAVGARADLVVLTDTLEPTRVLARGRWIDSAGAAVNPSQ